MNQKSSNEKTKLKTNILKNPLFKKLTDKELKEIKGGNSNSLVGSGNFTSEFENIGSY